MVNIASRDNQDFIDTQQQIEKAPSPFVHHICSKNHVVN